jgi:NAD(P)H-flavin reductase/ferredoxin
MDYNLCILCGRCVRICNELRGIGAINLVNRGHDTKISTAFDLLHLDTNCQFCGACVDICPTGALTSKNTKWFDKSSEKITSLCGFCSVGCEFEYFSYNGKLVESIPKKEDIDNRKKVCLFGRFCSVPFNNGKERLMYPLIKKNNYLIPCEWDEAYNIIRENLIKYKPEEIAVLASSDLSNESAYVLNKFANKILKTENIALVFLLNGIINTNSFWRKANSEGVFQNIYHYSKRSSEDIVKDIKNEKIKVLYLTERLENLDLLKNIEFLIVQDIYPSDNFQYADVVLPATTFFEQSGSFINSELRLQNFLKVASKIGKSKPDWQIICELAKTYNNSIATEFGFSNSKDILKELNIKNPHFGTDLSKNSKNLETYSNIIIPTFENDVSQFIKEPLTLDLFKYRGEKISNQVADLKQLIEYRQLRKAGKKIKTKRETSQKTRFKVKSNIEIALNMYKMVIEAPLIAKKAKPGNFIIIMKDETSERVPLTISDWNELEGTITVYIIDRGYSTSDLIKLSEDDYIYSVVGPLGNEIELKKYGTVLLGGGCYGIGAIYPIAKALKSAGNKLIIALESRNKLQFYLEKEFEDFADKVIYMTADGSKGIKGRIDNIEAIINENKPLDLCFFVGCKHMMMEASNITKKMGNILTFVSMNTIMIDGTGMCGGCRLSLIQNGKEITKFACIDGPIFDGHLINWEELMIRSEQFNESEIEVYQNHSCKAIERFMTGEKSE